MPCGRERHVITVTALQQRLNVMKAIETVDLTYREELAQ